MKSPNQHANASQGHESTTAEAAMNPQNHYPAKELWDSRRFHSDLPQLPDYL
jgi:hypothetical protein